MMDNDFCSYRCDCGHESENLRLVLTHVASWHMRTKNDNIVDRTRQLVSPNPIPDRRIYVRQ